MNIWDTLSDVLADRKVERPPNSITAEELAAKLGCTPSYAALRLRAKVASGTHKAIRYRTERGRPGMCYVVA